jgi:hypothetical protein
MLQLEPMQIWQGFKASFWLSLAVVALHPDSMQVQIVIASQAFGLIPWSNNFPLNIFL